MHTAVDGDPLRHLQAPAARHQRRRFHDLDVVELIFPLAPDLERIAEALGGDETGRRSLALDQGIAEERGGMHHAANFGRSNVGCVAETIDARHDAARGVVVCGELFVARLASGRRVVNDDIGEGATNIDPHPKALHTLSPSTEPGQTPFISQGNKPRMPSAAVAWSQRHWVYASLATVHCCMPSRTKLVFPEQ